MRNTQVLPVRMLAWTWLCQIPNTGMVTSPLLSKTGHLRSPGSMTWLSGKSSLIAVFIPPSLLTIEYSIVATWYKLAHFEPGTGVPYDLLSPHEDQKVTALSPDSKDTIYQGAVEGHVLVKNVNNALPLNSPKILSLYGYDGPAPTTVNPGSGFSKWTLGFNSINISDVDLLTFFSGSLSDEDIPQAAYGGTLISGGGSGAATPPYISSPFDAFAQRAYEDSTQIFWDFTSQDPNYEAGSDACLVFINAFATEGVSIKIPNVGKGKGG